MGLFDEFVLVDPVACPSCGSKIDLFQTKSLTNMLEMYKQGDEIKICGLSVSAGTVECYIHCKECKAWIVADAVIENGRFVGMKNVRTEVDQ